MYRVLLSILLGLGLVFVGQISYGLEDSAFFFESWFCSFFLPVWSILSISLWHDTGRLFFSNWIDSKDSTSPLWLRSLTFILWMSIIFTYVVWVHISLQVVQMLLLVPLIGIPLREYLIKDWSKLEYPTKQESLSLMAWVFMSYPVYWILTIGWILIRVFVLEMTTDGFVYYIQ